MQETAGFSISAGLKSCGNVESLVLEFYTVHFLRIRLFITVPSQW